MKRSRGFPECRPRMPIFSIGPPWQAIGIVSIRYGTVHRPVDICRENLKRNFAIYFQSTRKFTLCMVLPKPPAVLPTWIPIVLKHKLDSIGKPISDVTLRIVDEKGNEVPIGQAGELVASGPNIMSGLLERYEKHS